jgi:alkylation response protein AidB-like acyl-CoA dehydrogenase
MAAQLALAQGSASTALVAGMAMHLFGHARETRPWAENTFAQFCQAVVSDGALFNFVASEPALGSPSRGGLFFTTAQPASGGDGWLINGHKTWATGGRHLTHLLVRVSVEGESGVVLVEQDRPGVSWRETWRDALCLRASDSHDVLFQDVRVPRQHLIEQGKGTPNVWFPMVISSVYLGCALAARNAVIRFTLERVPTALGKPISTLPKIRRQIGEIDVALQAAQALFFQVAGQWAGDEDQRDAMLARVAAAKMMVTETALQVTEKVLQIAGGASLNRELPLERHFRDVRAGAMQPPAGDTAYELVGQAAISALAFDP